MKATLLSQYLALKASAPNALVLLRVGDFFEFLYDDAKIASEQLGLLLTKRECGGGESAPMCGFPAHSLSAYVNKLASLGFKVAVCEQKKSDERLMDRDITRIVTPGTLTDESLLESRSNNYLLSLYADDNGIGAGWTDISTGEVGYCFIDSLTQLNNTLGKLNPVEIICNNDMALKSVTLTLVKYGGVCPFTLFDESAFSFTQASMELKSRVENSEDKHCISALGALFAYIDYTKAETISPDSISVEPMSKKVMRLDGNTRRTLELFNNIADNKRQGSLIWALDKTKTAMGARNMHKWLLNPLTDTDEMCRRHDGVDALKNSPLLSEIADNLEGICDLERTGTRLLRRGLNGKDCLKIAQSLLRTVSIKKCLNQISAPILNELNKEMDSCGQLYELIYRTIDSKNELSDAISEDVKTELDALNEINESNVMLIFDTLTVEPGIIKSGVNSRLDMFRRQRESADKYMQYIIEREIELTGLKLKLERSKTQGYYIEVPKSQIKQIPYRYKRIQTLASHERFKTDVLIETEEKIVYAQNMIYALEAAIFEKLTEVMRSHGSLLIKSARALAELDCLTSFALISKAHNYVRPKMFENGVIDIKDGRHPVVERCENALSSFEGDLSSQSAEFVPNDTFLDSGENKIMLITGPNMSGKSVYMRQVALIVLMSHIGCFVPAKSAQICVVDQIFTRIGAGDDVSKGRSTFMTEMAEVAEILSFASPRSLLLLDEIGRGTSTYDGVSIAWAMLECLDSDYECKVLFSTHYHELIKLEGVLKSIKNYKMTVKEEKDTIVFLRKLTRGFAERSFGIEVASIAGVNNKIISRAQQIMLKLEKTSLV